MPLSHLSNFWRTFKTSLISCEISLNLRWSKNCVLTSQSTINALPVQDGNNPGNAVFEITDCKLYVAVVTLSAENENKLLDQLKTRFPVTVEWNKYRCQISNQTANNNLNYLTDPTVSKVHRLYVVAYQIEEDRFSFSKYYTLTAEIIDCFNVLIDQKTFFGIAIKK